MKVSSEHLLTTHAGSLPRPESLRDLLRTEFEHGDLDREQLEREIKDSVTEVVAQQAKVGLTVVNDGEHSKYSFTTYVKHRLTGIEEIVIDQKADRAAGYGLWNGAVREVHAFPEFFARAGHPDGFMRSGRTAQRAMRCTGPIGWQDFDAVQRDIANLKDAAKAVSSGIEEIFMSAASPGNTLQKVENQYYPSTEEYLEALARTMHDEFKAIVDAGFVLQLDCPDLATRAVESEVRAYREGRMVEFSLEEFRREVARNVEALNLAIQGLPPERIRLHVCWGSTEQPHHLDPELKDFVDILLCANAAGLMVVAANGRHEHEWRVWEDVKLPEDKVLLPGVVDSTTNIVEHPDTVADRLIRFASVVRKEQLIANVDCGFQTTAGRDQVDPRVAWAKLRSLAQGAQIASDVLWGRTVKPAAVGAR